jgi:putative PEP-CTERM system TPR-repeat lipoprotein
MKSFLHLLSVILKAFAAAFLFSFFVLADTAEDYERALEAFSNKRFPESYIHLKNALQKSPSHLPSKLLMGRILLIDGYTAEAITEFKEVIDAGADMNLVIIPLANAHLIRQEYQQVIELVEPLNVSSTTKLDLLLLKATSYLRLHEYTQAKSLYQYGQGIFGDEIGLINGLAQIALLEKNMDTARTLVTTSLQIDPKNGHSLLLSGLIYYAQKQTEAAMQAFLLAYQYAPDNPAIKRSLANSYAQAGMISKAQKLVAEIEKQSPNDLQTKLLKARLLAMSEKNKEADAVLTELSQALSFIDTANQESFSNLSLIAGITAYINQNYDVSVREIERYLRNEEATIELVTMLADGYKRLSKRRKAIQILERHENLVLEDIEVSSVLCNLYLSDRKIFKCVTLLESLKKIHHDHPTLLLLQAKLSHHRGHPEEALDSLNKLMKDTSSSDILLFQTGLLAQLKRFDEALLNAKNLLNTEPDNVAYINLNVDLLIRTRELDLAESMLQKVLEQDPENIAGQVHKSRILFGQNKPDGALDIIKRVLKIQPANPSALFLSGQILTALNRLDDAIEQLIAVKVLQNTNPAPIELLVNIYKKQSRFDLALSEINQLLKLDFTDSDYLIEKTNLLVEMGDIENAKSQLNILYGQWYSDLNRLIELSKYQIIANDLVGAEKTLKRAMVVSPKSLLAKLEYSKFLLKQKRIVDAKKIIYNLRKTHPQNSNVALMYGNLSNAVGQTEQAYLAYRQAFELSPDFMLALIELYQLARKNIHTLDVIELILANLETKPEAHFQRHLLADLYFLNNEFSEAEEHYQYLTKVDNLTKKASIFNNLANISRNNDLVEALAYAEKAAVLNPNSAAILDTKGWLLTLNDNAQEGLNVLRQAFTLQSNDPTIRYHIAYSLHKLGRNSEAKSELKFILQNNKKFPELPQVKELFEAM